jgi:hypothetical protein
MASDESIAQTRWQRPPVMILGAHRSGTTATARALEVLGLQIGQQLDSHREPKALQRLHENYLKRLGAAWHTPGPFLESIQTPEGERHCLDYLRRHTEREFSRIFGYRRNPLGFWLLARLRTGAAWGWKEPRTTLFGALWLQLFPNARVVDVIRHPLTVAMSIRQRELNFRGAGDTPVPKLDELDHCLRLALTYIELGEGLARQARHYRRIRFEEIQADSINALRELAEFCGLPSTSATLTQAAATIRPRNSHESRSIPQEHARELLSNYPMVGKLGYRL